MSVGRRRLRRLHAQSCVSGVSRETVKEGKH